MKPFRYFLAASQGSTHVYKSFQNSGCILQKKNVLEVVWYRFQGTRIEILELFNIQETRLDAIWQDVHYGTFFGMCVHPQENRQIIEIMCVFVIIINYWIHFKDKTA